MEVYGKSKPIGVSSTRGVEEMAADEKKSKVSYRLGEAVRNKVTGQVMYVDIPWHPEVTCVYYDLETSKLVKVDVSPEDLEKEEELLFKRV